MTDGVKLSVELNSKTKQGMQSREDCGPDFEELAVIEKIALEYAIRNQRFSSALEEIEYFVGTIHDHNEDLKPLIKNYDEIAEVTSRLRFGWDLSDRNSELWRAIRDLRQLCRSHAMNARKQVEILFKECDDIDTLLAAALRKGHYNY